MKKEGVILPALVALYAVAAVSSQTLLDSTMVAIALGVIWLFFKNRHAFTFKKIGIEWAVLTYIVVVILGYVVNGTSQAGWRDSIIKFSWIINVYFLIYAFQSFRLETVSVIKSLTVLTLIPTVYSLFSYLNGADFITDRENSRITGFVNSSTYHAHGNAVLLVILLGCLYFSYAKLKVRWKVFGLFSTGLLALSILLTFTRGIWLSLLVSSFLILLALDWKKLLQFVFVSAAAFLICFQTWPKFQERILHSSNAYSNRERIDLFRVNVQMWKEYPWLGIGYGENLRRNREYWDRPEWNRPAGYLESHAHNQYLNVLSTTGLLGLISFSLFFFFFLIKNMLMLRKTERKRQPERFAILLTCLWVQLEFYLGCLSDVSFEYAKIRALIILVWALVIAIDQKPALVQEEFDAR